MFISYFLIVIYFFNVDYKTKQNNSKIKSEYLETGWYYVTENGKGVERILESTGEVFYIDPKPIVTTKDFFIIKLEENNSGNPYLSIKFNGRGTTAWRIATGKAVGKNLAFILDDELLVTPYVNSQIDFGVSAIGYVSYDENDLLMIKQKIEEGK